MYHGFNETIEDFIINKCSSSLEILENGKWIFQEGEISDINITGYIKDHLSHSENNVIVKLRDRSVPVKVPAEKKLVIDVSISGAGDFENVITSYSIHYTKLYEATTWRSLIQISTTIQ